MFGVNSSLNQVLRHFVWPIQYDPYSMSHKFYTIHLKYLENKNLYTHFNTLETTKV